VEISYVEFEEKTISEKFSKILSKPRLFQHYIFLKLKIKSINLKILRVKLNLIKKIYVPKTFFKI